MLSMSYYIKTRNTTSDYPIQLENNLSSFWFSQRKRGNKWLAFEKVPNRTGPFKMHFLVQLWSQRHHFLHRGEGCVDSHVKSVLKVISCTVLLQTYTHSLLQPSLQSSEKELCTLTIHFISNIWTNSCSYVNSQSYGSSGMHEIKQINDNSSPHPALE